MRGTSADMDWSKGYKVERQASWDDIAQAIHDSVTMDDVIDAYCPGVQRRNHRMPCPIHDGKGPNFSYTRNGYKCFVCGASGDVVSFVSEVCGLRSRADAMRKINQDLRLGLPIGSAVNDVQSAEIQRRRKEAEQKRKAHDEWWALYHKLMDEWTECDKVKRSAEPFSDEWCAAVKRLEYLNQALDEMPQEPG